MHPASSPFLEPGAIPGDPQLNGMTEPVIWQPPWDPIDVSVTASFVSVEPVILPAGTNLYRVFSYPNAADPYPSWEVGSWWSPTPIPDSEAEWRGGFAVEESWNGGQYSVQWTLPSQTYAWQGPTSLQPGEYVNGDPAPGYYLPGGLIQVYITPSLMGIGDWSANPSPWRPLALEPPVQAAPAPAKTASDLMHRLGELSDCLSRMVQEAQGKGLYDYHLRFLAGRVAKERDLLQRYIAAGDTVLERAIVNRLTALTRNVYTSYPWSANAATATKLVRDIVASAVRIAHAKGV